MHRGIERYSYAQIALHWVVVLLVIEQYLTSAAILRVHGYRPLGRPADPFDLTLHALHTRVGVLIFALVAIRLALRIRWARCNGSPRFRTGGGDCLQASSTDSTLSFSGKLSPAPSRSTCGGR